jgi:hypothetical protein
MQKKSDHACLALAAVMFAEHLAGYLVLRWAQSPVAERTS